MKRLHLNGCKSTPSTQHRKDSFPSFLTFHSTTNGLENVQKTEVKQEPKEQAKEGTKEEQKEKKKKDKKERKAKKEKKEKKAKVLLCVYVSDIAEALC